MKKQTKKPLSAPKKRFHERVFESDSTYFLKLVVIVLLGTLWLKFANPFMLGGLSVHGHSTRYHHRFLGRTGV